MKYLFPLAILVTGCVHVSQPNDEAHYECYVQRNKPVQSINKMLPCADADNAATKVYTAKELLGTWCQVGIYKRSQKTAFSMPKKVDCEVYDNAPGTPFIDIRPT